MITKTRNYTARELRGGKITSGTALIMEHVGRSLPDKWEHNPKDWDLIPEHRLPPNVIFTPRAKL